MLLTTSESSEQTKLQASYLKSYASKMTSLLVEEGRGIVSDETTISAQRVQRYVPLITLARKSIDSLLISIDAAVTKARSECLELSSSVYNKLPKELRDYVYAYLCLEDRRIPVGPYYHFRKYEPLAKKELGYSDTQYCPRDGDLQTELADGKTRIDHDIYPEGDLVLPKSHIFDPSFMGQDVVPELLEMYYGSNSFSVCNIDGGLDELCTAIPSSSAPSRLVPIDHVRDLQIRMKFEHIKPHVCPLRRIPGCFHTGYVAGDESQFRAAVDTLRTFRTRTLASPHEMNIEVILMTDLDTPQDDQDAGTYANAYFTNFLQSVRNMVYELLHDCERVSVRVTHQDDGLMAFPKDYTKLFSLSKDEWEYVSVPQKLAVWGEPRVLMSIRKSQNKLPIATGTRTIGSFLSRVLV